MLDKFASLAVGFDAPYSRIVPITQFGVEFEPCRALWINCKDVITFLPAASEEEVTLVLGLTGHYTGELKVRARKIISTNNPGAGNLVPVTSPLANPFIGSEDDIYAFYALY